MRVLVVEDDLALGAFLKNGLQLEGHQVDWVGDGDAALVNAAAHLPDLIVLDLSLPKRDGMEVLAELRFLHNDASVLVLTGRNELDARVRCLDLGADDCLLKPFNFSELTARCRALLRRREQFADPILRHGDLILNRMERTVIRGTRTIDLTAKEFSLLACLLLHRGECVSRSQLLVEAWQMPAEGGTNIVDVYINYLRRKLSDGYSESASHSDATQGDLIETVRGSGYRLCSLEPKSKPVIMAGTSRAAVA
jgi:DNA-binding response OmpR family regulator